MSAPDLLEFVIRKVSNLTSSSAIYTEGKDDAVEVVNYTDTGVSVIIASNRCQKGHLVEIDGTIYIDFQEYDFCGSGKVMTKTEIENGREKLNLDFNTYDRETWGRFTEALNKRQDSTDEVFYSIKVVE